MPNTPQRPNKRRRGLFDQSGSPTMSIETPGVTTIDRFHIPPGSLFATFQDLKEHKTPVPYFTSSIGLLNQRLYQFRESTYTYRQTSRIISGGILHPIDGASDSYYICKQQSFHGVFGPKKESATFLMVPISKEEAESMLSAIGFPTPPPSSDDSDDAEDPFRDCATGNLFGP